MSKTLQERLAEETPEVRAIAEKLFGDISQDELEIARTIANMSHDVCAGDKASAKEYLQRICDEVPAVKHLFGRVGYQIEMAAGARKQ